MNRIVRQTDAEAIADAMSWIPPRVRRLAERCDVATRIDPLFVGLHRFESTDVGSYRELAHVTYPHHQMHRPAAERRTTVVLPAAALRRDAETVRYVIVHELGHVLHEQVDHRFTVVPITPYAKTNRFEAFAEAFAAWVLGPWWRFTDTDRPIVDRLRDRDPRCIALFESLEAA